MQTTRESDEPLFSVSILTFMHIYRLHLFFQTDLNLLIDIAHCWLQAVKTHKDQEDYTSEVSSSKDNLNVSSVSLCVFQPNLNEACT